MKFFKRFTVVAACAVFSAASLSGCNLFSKRCNHNTYVQGFDENAHYKTCSDCGEKFDVEKHVLSLRHFPFDTVNHYTACQLCQYMTDPRPHTMTDWDTSCSKATNSRKCTTKGCTYEEICNHPKYEYVCTEEKHTAICSNCKMSLAYRYDAKNPDTERFMTKNHLYDTFKADDENTHKKSCICGKTVGESVPHVMRYTALNGEHWRECACGIYTEKEKCTYEFDYDGLKTHYQKCTVCKKTAGEEEHAFKLTEARTRECPVCGCILPVERRLIGTWQFTHTNLVTYLLTLNDDWSYTCVRKDSGKVEAHGDYKVTDTRETNAGNYKGTISFAGHPDTLEFTFIGKINTSFTAGYVFSKQ